MSHLRPMSVREAADALGVSVRTVQRWVLADTLPAEKLPGRTAAYLIDPNAVDALVAARDPEFVRPTS